MSVVLDWIESNDEFVLTTEDSRNEAIDFSISVDGDLRVVVQAKAAVDGPYGTTFAPADLADAVGDLLDEDAEQYLIWTNRPISGQSVALIEYIARADEQLTADEFRDGFSGFLRPQTFRRIADLDQRRLQRLRRLTVVSVVKDVDTFATSITRRVLRLRRRLMHGGGADSAAVLLNYVVADLLRRSGRRSGRSMVRSDVERILGLASRTLAYSLDEYDWGNVTGPFPALRAAVSRPSLLNDLLQAIDGSPEERLVRPLAVLGLSGVGKSSLAATFCSLVAPRYARIVWIDASSADAIRRQAANVLGTHAVAASDDDLAAMFRDYLSQDPNSWLLVFDNASSSRDLLPWLPPSGHVDVLATSTNTASWAHWPQVRVGVMSEEEAMGLVRLRLGSKSLSDYDRARAKRLVNELDFWPLAIELACAFLSRSARGLALTGEYLRRLTGHVVDDASLIPDDYRSHPTLLQAIFVALDTVEDADQTARGMRAGALLTTLAYLPPRAAPLDVAGRITIFNETKRGRWRGDVPTDDVDVTFTIDDAIARLAVASLVERYDQSGPIAARTRTNAIILDVVRQLQDEHERTALLALMQFVIGEHLRQSLEDEDFPTSYELAESAVTAVRFGLDYAVVTHHAVITLGNIATYWQARGEHQRALAAYSDELALLEASGIQADQLRAKIHAGILYSQLNLNAASETLAGTVKAALTAAESAVAADPSAATELEPAIAQVIEVLHVLERSSVFTAQQEVGGWRTRAAALAPNAIQDVAKLRAVKAALGTPGNDDEATLRDIESELGAGASGRRRTDLLFTRAEALASLGRYGEATDAVTYAVAQSRSLALGVAPGWTPMLNAWRGAVTLKLATNDQDATLRQFCAALDDLLWEEKPALLEDGAALALCRAATTAMTGPLDLATRRIRAIETLTFAPSHLIHDTVNPELLQQACTRILDLRRRTGATLLAHVYGWSRVVVPDSGTRIYVLAVSSEAAATIRATVGNGCALGRWISSADGVGLDLSSTTDAILWLPARGSGWIDLPESPMQTGTHKLRALVIDRSDHTSDMSAVLTTMDPVADPYGILATGIPVEIMANHVPRGGAAGR